MLDEAIECQLEGATRILEGRLSSEIDVCRRIVDAGFRLIPRFHLAVRGSCHQLLCDWPDDLVSQRDAFLWLQALFSWWRVSEFICSSRVRDPDSIVFAYVAAGLASYSKLRVEDGACAAGEPISLPRRTVSPLSNLIGNCAESFQIGRILQVNSLFGSEPDRGMYVLSFREAGGPKLVGCIDNSIALVLPQHLVGT